MDDTIQSLFVDFRLLPGGYEFPTESAVLLRGRYSESM